MKKLLLSVVAASVFSFGLVIAKTESLVSIDSILLMQESKEGKKLTDQIKNKISGFQEYVKKSQEELIALQQEISAKAEVLSKEAIQEKTERIAKKKKDMERIIADKEEALRMDIQKDQLKLREKQMTIANKMFEKEEWGMMIDKNTPGVLFVSKAIDKTSEVLKVVDEQFDVPALKKDGAKKIVAGKVKPELKQA